MHHARSVRSGLSISRNLTVQYTSQKLDIVQVVELVSLLAATLLYMNHSVQEVELHNCMYSRLSIGHSCID